MKITAIYKKICEIQHEARKGIFFMRFQAKIKKWKSDCRIFLNYVRNNRILLHPETRKIGIAAILIGWALIAFSTVIFQKSIKTIPPSMNFFFQFLAGTAVLFIAGICNGKKFFKINETKKLTGEAFKSDLPVSWRKGLIYFRSIIAIFSYMALSWTKAEPGLLDQSTLFSADAIFYAAIFYWIFKEKITPYQFWGIVIAFIGISLFFSFDIVSWRATLIGVTELFSSLCMAVIFLLTLILVQHDYPLRIAFYQCAFGLLISAVIVLTKLLTGSHFLFVYPLHEVIYSMLSGITYAIALLFFFNAFLYTESILLVVLGYSLTPFVILFTWFTEGGKINLYDLAGFILIALGGGLVAYSEYRMGKMKKNLIGTPSYIPSLVERFRDYRKDFRKGKLDQYDYMSKCHEFNKLLFAFSEGLEGTDIKNIEITKDCVLFTIGPNIKMETDGACRSAPMEMLNFGSYEPKEIDLVCHILHDEDVIFDIGAHIGYYSIVLAKHFPNARIFAFEPILNTFSILEKNIRANSLQNIHAFNYGLSDKPKDTFFYYFKDGSTLASQIYLLGYSKTQKIKCHLERLDDVISSLGIEKLNFIKCDIEGEELAAIQGGLGAIGQFLPICLVTLHQERCAQFNYSANDVLHIFEKLGYQCFSIINKGFKREKIIKEEWNYFFLHTDKHNDLIRKYS